MKRKETLDIGAVVAAELKKVGQSQKEKKRRERLDDEREFRATERRMDAAKRRGEKIQAALERLNDVFSSVTKESKVLCQQIDNGISLEMRMCRRMTDCYITLWEKLMGKRCIQIGVEREGYMTGFSFTVSIYAFNVDEHYRSSVKVFLDRDDADLPPSVRTALKELCSKEKLVKAIVRGSTRLLP